LDAISDIGQTLKNRGIYLSLGYVEDFLADTGGGRQRGMAPTGEWFGGAIFDLETMVGIPSASVHITFDERNGYTINNLVGTQAPPLAANSGPTREVRLSEFYWEQGFYNDRIDIVVGRTNPTTDFATSAISCNWVSSIICAQPGTWYFSNDNQAYPASTWGGRINVAPAPNFYARAAVYEDNTKEFQVGQQGFNWGTSTSNGVFVPAEIGYSTAFTSTRYPEKYDIGGYYDAANYTTPAGLPQRNRSAIWGQFEKTFWRPDTNTTQSLTALGGVIWYQGSNPYWTQAYLGLVDRAPFGPGRPNDTFNIIGTYISNNTAYAPSHSDTWVFEANYGFSLWPGVIIKPVTQYIIRPDEIGFVNPKRPGNAWVVGVQLSLDAAAALKFPQFVPH
jgi:porin